VCSPDTRLVLNFHSNLWRPWINLATFLRLRKPVKDVNWLSMSDVKNLLYLAGFESVSTGGRVLFPIRIPVLHQLLNRFIGRLPFFELGSMTWYVVARPAADTPVTGSPAKPSVSIVIPTRNEKGNIEQIFTRTPSMGLWTELVFVDGHSDDGTVEEIRRCMDANKRTWPRVKLLAQAGRGKGPAVRQGFEACEGDVLMILDSDLTMPPEELPKYYDAIVSRRGEFINGCRLVYPQEEKAMRFLNMLANHFFASMFSWLLSQRMKDTLCGTKVFWRSDYQQIARNRAYFGDFDPYGDFDLLFGASHLNRKIVDIPVRYRSRTYGDIKIQRWRDGMLLFRMCAIAYRRFKLG
jgi:hypothetical protein